MLVNVKVIFWQKETTSSSEVRYDLALPMNKSIFEFSFIDWLFVNQMFLNVPRNINLLLNNMVHISTCRTIFIDLGFHYINRRVSTLCDFALLVNVVVEITVVENIFVLYRFRDYKWRNRYFLLNFFLLHKRYLA